MVEQTFEEYFNALDRVGKYRFLLNHYRMCVRNEVATARYWRSQGREGAMYARLIDAKLASTKARLCLREIRALERSA